MKERLNYAKAAPGYRAMAALQTDVYDCGLEPLLLELVKMRASQINGCAYCLDMHSKDARAIGESEQRLYELNAWRENTLLHRTRTRRSALDRGTHADQPGTRRPDAVYEEVRQHFSEEELVNLTLTIVAINGWNRLAISFRSQPGVYQSTKAAFFEPLLLVAIGRFQ